MEEYLKMLPVVVVFGGVAWGLIELRCRKLFVLQVPQNDPARFATVGEVNALGAKVNLLEGHYREAMALVNTLTIEVRELRTEQRHHWERLIHPLETLTEELKELRADFNEHLLTQTELNAALRADLESRKAQNR